MATKISGTLSAAGIRSIQNQLKQYKKRLIEKCEIFTKRLSEIGIQAAQIRLDSSMGTEEQEMAKYITFSTEVNPTQYGVKTLMLATSGMIERTWLVKGGTKTVDVSPLLMVEFGSGVRANNEHGGEFGMGRGTFPDQTHAFNDDGWYWQTVDGEWHHSYGISPSMPMYYASKSMMDSIVETAREVFGS